MVSTGSRAGRLRPEVHHEVLPRPELAPDAGHAGGSLFAHALQHHTAQLDLDTGLREPVLPRAFPRRRHLERRAAGVRYAAAIAVGSAVIAILAASPWSRFSTLHGNLFWLSELTTALVSGVTVSGMLLGHWYLTAPTMTTTPLNRVNLWLGLVAGAKLLLGGLTLACWPLISAQTTVIDQWNFTYGTWLSLALLGGIFGPLGVCWMVHRILKYGNTQSATGVLFVGVILAFIGEMTGALLRRELQLPV